MVYKEAIKITPGLVSPAFEKRVCYSRCCRNAGLLLSFDVIFQCAIVRSEIEGAL